jgi:hypothetical protein
VYHFGAEKSLPDFAEYAYPCAGCKLFDLAHVEIQEAHHQHAGVVLHRTHELPLGSVLDRTVDDLTFNERSAAEWRFADAVETRFVVVSEWQVQDEIKLALNAEFGECREYGFAVSRE